MGFTGIPEHDASIAYTVEGRMYPVEVHYLRQPQPDYVASAVAIVVDIHFKEPLGDILIFLTGEAEVESGSNALYLVS